MQTINRRRFFGLAAAASATTLSSRWVFAQAAAVTDMVAQARASAASVSIKTTKLYDNVFLLQGAGGNMVAQIGSDGKRLIDASFSTAVSHIREALDALSKDPAHALVNTHWHFDHTDGNEGLHQAGYRIVAHIKTKERLSKPQTIKLLNISLPAVPAGALPEVTFEDKFTHEHNGDTVDLVHFEPAHTDTDIYVHFHKADVIHLGDTWFNGTYPFIDESSGGNIGGMIKANDKALAIAGSQTKIVPGHGPLGSKAELQQFRDMLATVSDRVAKLKKSGASEAEVIAKKPTSDLDVQWGKGMLNGDRFVGIVYRTLDT